MAADPLAMLLELHAACAAGRAPAPAVGQWFAEGMQRAVARGERLDEGLGLSGAGTCSLQTRLAYLARDRHLVAAARCTTLGPASISNWEQATRLAPLIAEFVAEWPRLRRLADPRAEWPGWKAHVFRAAQCDLPLPCTAVRIAELIDGAKPNPPFSFEWVRPEHSPP